MQAEFRAPRRRSRVFEAYEGPLPVGRCTDAQRTFRGDLINQQVLVCHPDHIQKIHSQGFFGKGILSRARPDRGISDRWENHQGVFLPVISQSRYAQLLRWAESSLAAQGLSEEAVAQTLSRLTGPVEIEDVKKDAGGESELRRGQVGAGPLPVGGVSPHKRRLQSGAEDEPKNKRSCRTEPQHQNPYPDRDPTSDQEPCALSKPEPSFTQEPKPGSDEKPELGSKLEPDSGSDLDPASGSDLDPASGSDLDPASGSDCDADPVVPGPGYVLVVSDSEGDGETRQIRRTPFRQTEYLQLSCEETFFLVYGVGCLSVYLQQEPLSIIQLWRTLQSLRPNFVSLYAAYHHFRSKGWVPKGGAGAKYGVDLMLYRKGPPFYHASYSVVVERVDDDAFTGATLRPFSWRSLAALSRITANVSKELMLCYIICPHDLSEAELDSPECLRRLKVQEVMVSRWVSSRERAEHEDI